MEERKKEKQNRRDYWLTEVSTNFIHTLAAMYKATSLLVQRSCLQPVLMVSGNSCQSTASETWREVPSQKGSGDRS